MPSSFADDRFTELEGSVWCHAVLDGCVRFAHDPQLRLFRAVLRNEAPSSAHAEVNARVFAVFTGVRKATRARRNKQSS